MKIRRFMLDMLVPDALFIPHPEHKQLWIMHLGFSRFEAHKFYSALYLTIEAVLAGRDIRLSGDRSSGSWAMGVAYATSLITGGKGSSRFVSVGEPPVKVREFVDAHGGRFDVVQSNIERLAWMDERREEGYFLPDQHHNTRVIDAFDFCIAPELSSQITAHGLKPWGVIGPVGTGGVLAGTVRGLRERGHPVRSIGTNIASSIQPSAPRPPTIPWLKCRGVGATDEICGTFCSAKEYIDELLVSSPFEAAKYMAAFDRHSVGCGMSGGLTLAIACQEVLSRVPDGQCLIAILPDSPELYPAELEIARQLNPER